MDGPSGFSLCVVAPCYNEVSVFKMAALAMDAIVSFSATPMKRLFDEAKRRPLYLFKQTPATRSAEVQR